MHHSEFSDVVDHRVIYSIALLYIKSDSACRVALAFQSIAPVDFALGNIPYDKGSGMHICGAVTHVQC